MLYSIIDVETTGYPNNKITDISIFVTDGKKIIDEFHTLLNPEQPIPYSITRLTKITNEMVQDAPFFYQIAKRVIEITRDTVFVAHNVNFDYQVIKNEFKHLGYTYQRKKLCTVKLSRKIIPGHKSYSLGKLCKDLKIPIHGRHRAKGDAFATYKLFLMMFKKSNDEIFSTNISEKQLTVSNYIDENNFNDYPKKTGVYYFWDIHDKIIYVGKSINIKERVVSHFRSTTKKEVKMCQQVAKITYAETGNDLIAQLKESAEIKKYYPIFNRRQKQEKENFGISYFTNSDGIIELRLDYVKQLTNPILTFEKKQSANMFLEKLVEKHNLCLKYTGIEKSNSHCFNFQLKKCLGVCAEKESVKEYNKRVIKILSSFSNDPNQTSIFLCGRLENEKSFVLIENGVYKGYGFFPSHIREDEAVLNEKFLVKQKENRDTKRILRSYFRNND